MSGALPMRTARVEGGVRDPPGTDRRGLDAAEGRVKPPGTPTIPGEDAPGLPTTDPLAEVVELRMTGGTSVDGGRATTLADPSRTNCSTFNVTEGEGARNVVESA